MTSTVRTRLLAPALAATLAAGLTGAGLQAPAAATKHHHHDRSQQDVTFEPWDFGDGDPGGSYDGTTRSRAGKLFLTEATGSRSYDDPYDSPDAGPTTYDEATWTSPRVRTRFGLTELVSSWNAQTPAGTWIEVAVQGTTDHGTTSKWYVLGRWAEQDDAGFHPTSLGGQGDDDATVAIDTLVTRDGVAFDDYRIRVSLLREHGSGATPEVGFVGAMASDVVIEEGRRTSRPLHRARELDVPTYSQEKHLGHFPQWDNGGEAWCSPTSTSMVLRYWSPSSPPAPDYAWVYDEQPDETDPYVDYAARHTYDYNYDGAGNWPFNTAYAARFDLEGFVTRLRSLREAEQFVGAGIPVVVSMSFEEDELDGAGYGTNGHLLTIVGFQRDGDVIVNDPASHLVPSNDEVRVVYDRDQFETAWIGSTGGISYIIHPDAVHLPRADRRQPNW